MLQRIDAMTSEDFHALIDRPKGKGVPFNLEALQLAARPPAGESQYHEEAAIAYTLSDLLEKDITPQSTLRIVGSNRPNLTQKGYRWGEDLLRWDLLGVQIRYLLINPGDETLKVMQTLAKNGKGNLQVWVAQLNIDNEPADEEQAWLQELESTHFTTLSDPSLLWFEEHHPEQSIKATGCRFYPSTSAYGQAVGTTLNARFDELITCSHVTQTV